MMPSGYGGGFFAHLWLYSQPGSPVSTSNDTNSYHPPILIPNTLHQNPNRYPTADTVAFENHTPNPIQIAFSGAYFVNDPTVTTITYGSVSVAPQPCTLLTYASSETSIQCQTAPASSGALLFLTVTVDGQSVVSTDTITFPVQPI